MWSQNIFGLVVLLTTVVLAAIGTTLAILCMRVQENDKVNTEFAGPVDEKHPRGRGTNSTIEVPPIPTTSYRYNIPLINERKCALTLTRCNVDSSGVPYLLGLFNVGEIVADGTLGDSGSRKVSLWKRGKTAADWIDQFRAQDLDIENVIDIDINPGCDRIMVATSSQLQEIIWSTDENTRITTLANEGSPLAAYIGNIIRAQYDELDKTHFYALDDGQVCWYNGSEWTVVDDSSYYFNKLKGSLVSVAGDKQSIKFFRKVGDAWAQDTDRTITIPDGSEAVKAIISVDLNKVVYQVVRNEKSWYYIKGWDNGDWVDIVTSKLGTPHARFYHLNGAHHGLIYGDDGTLNFIPLAQYREQFMDLTGDIFGDGWQMSATMDNEVEDNTNFICFSHTYGIYQGVGHPRLTVYVKPFGPH